MVVLLQCSNRTTQRRSFPPKPRDYSSRWLRSALRIDVVSLMDTGVLSSRMKIAHASLQRRTLIDRAAAGQGKAGRRDADTGGCYPDPRLGALRLKSCCESLDHGQATGQIELEATMTFGHEHAKDTE